MSRLGHPKAERHYRYIISGNDAVFEIFMENPELSIRAIAEELRLRTGAGSTFYVYSVLKHHHLTTTTQRSAYLARQSIHITGQDRVLTTRVFADFLRGLVFPLALTSLAIVIVVPLSMNATKETVIGTNPNAILVKAPIMQITNPPLEQPEILS